MPLDLSTIREATIVSYAAGPERFSGGMWLCGSDCAEAIEDWIARNVRADFIRCEIDAFFGGERDGIWFASVYDTQDGEPGVYSGWIRLTVHAVAGAVASAEPLRRAA